MTRYVSLGAGAALLACGAFWGCGEDIDARFSSSTTASANPTASGSLDPPSGVDAGASKQKSPAQSVGEELPGDDVPPPLEDAGMSAGAVDAGLPRDASVAVDAAADGGKTGAGPTAVDAALDDAGPALKPGAQGSGPADDAASDAATAPGVAPPDAAAGGSAGESALFDARVSADSRAGGQEGGAGGMGSAGSVGGTGGVENVGGTGGVGGTEPVVFTCTIESSVNLGSRETSVPVDVSAGACLYIPTLPSWWGGGALSFQVRNFQDAAPSYTTVPYRWNQVCSGMLLSEGSGLFVGPGFTTAQIPDVGAGCHLLLGLAGVAGESLQIRYY